MPLDLLDEPTLSTSLPGFRKPAKVPPLEPEVKRSLIEEFGDSLGSMLGYAADTLDKYTGSKTVRSLLMGRSPSEAFSHFIPDWAGGAGVEAPSSVDLFESLVGKVNTGVPWLDNVLTFGGSFAVGMLTDPSTMVLGPGKAITAAGRASKMGIVGAGARLAEAGADDLLKPLVQRFSGMDELEKAGAKLLGEGVAPIAGSSPAQLAEEMNAGLRGAIGIRAPLAARMLGASDEPLFVLGAKNPHALAAVKFLYDNPISRSVRQVFDHRARGVYAKGGQAAADLTEKFVDANREGMLVKAVELQGKTNALKNVYDHELKDFLAKNKGVVDQITGGVPIESVGSDEFLRALAEFQSADASSGKLAGLLGQMRQSAAVPEGVMDAVRAFDGVVDEMLNLDDYWHRFAQQAGVPIGDLDDIFVRHFPRRANLGLEGGKAGSDEAWTSLHRTIRDIPGGTLKVNRASVDPRLSGTGAAVLPRQSRAAILANEYGATEPDALAAILEALPDTIRDTGGLFPRQALGDLTDYGLSLASRGSAYSSVLKMLAESADAGADGVTIRQFLNPAQIPGSKGIRFGSAAADRFAHEYGLLGKGQADLDGLRVPKSFAQAAERILKTESSPKESLAIVKALDAGLGLFRTGVYTLMPKAQVRNLVSGAYTNAIHAWDNPAQAKAALADTWEAFQGRGGKYLDEFKLFAGKTPGAVEAVQGLDVAGSPLTTWHDIKGAGKRTVDRFQQMANDLTSGNIKGLASDQNPLNPANIVGVRKSLAETAKKAGTDPESSFLYAGLMEKTGKGIEFFNRYGAYTALRDKGWSPAAAMRQVKLTHYDYTALTQTERTVFRRLLPFYGWTRKNLPAQLRSIVDDPGGPTAQTLRFIATGQEIADAKGEFVPSHLRGGLVVPLGGDRYFSSYGLTPVESAFSFGVTRNGEIDWKTVGESMLAQSPVLAAPLQQIAGKQFYSHRPLDDLHQYPTDDPDLNYWIGQSPLAGFTNLARTWGDDRKDTFTKLFNSLVGGAKLTDVNQDRALALDARDAVKKALSDAPGVGEFTSYYAADPNQMDGRASQLLALLGELNKDAAAAKKKAKQS